MLENFGIFCSELNDWLRVSFDLRNSSHLEQEAHVADSAVHGGIERVQQEGLVEHSPQVLDLKLWVPN